MNGYGYSYSNPMPGGRSKVLSPLEIDTPFLFVRGDLSAAAGAWGDQSPVPHDFSQGTMASQATHVAEAGAVKAHFLFDGVNDFFAQSTYRSFPSGITILAVVSTTSNANFVNIYTPGNTVFGDTTGTVVTALGVSAGRVQLCVYHGVFAQFSASVTCNNGTPKLIGCTINATTKVPRIITEDVIDTLAPLANYNPAHGFNVLGRGYSGGYFAGPIFSTAVYPKALSDVQLAQWLKWKRKEYPT